MIDSHLVYWIEAGMLGIGGLFYVLASWFTGALYKRLGGKAWHAWVPVFGNVRLLQTARLSGWWALLGAFFIWDAVESYLSVADTLNLLASQTREQLATLSNSQSIISGSMAENIASSISSIGAIVFSIVLWIAVHRVAKGFGHSPNLMVTLWALVQPAYFAVLAFGKREFDPALIKLKV